MRGQSPFRGQSLGRCDTALVAVPTLETEVLVVGGGSTGAGVVRDAAMRGFDGARRARRRPGDRDDRSFPRAPPLGRSLRREGSGRSPRECVVENPIVRRIAADCVEDTGGLFVPTPWDDPAYGDDFLRGLPGDGPRR